MCAEHNEVLGKFHCDYRPFVDAQGSLGSISLAFYEQLLLSQIPKGQKDTDSFTEFLRFWIYKCKSFELTCWWNRPLMWQGGHKSETWLLARGLVRHFGVYYAILKSTRRRGVNFINILHARFSYESDSHSFSLVTFWQKSTFVHKTRA